MKNFILKDELRHRAFSFPKTLLSFAFDGAAPTGNRTLLMDGQAIDYDCSSTEKGHVIKVFADLPYLGCHTFTWGDESYQRNALGNNNGEIAIESIKGGLFSVSVDGEKFFYRVATQLKLLSEEENVESGALESVITKTLSFEDGRSYVFCIKLKKELHYLEIYEDMSGFAPNEAKLVVDWVNFTPTNRYTKDRGIEKIDDYMDENGKFPFVVDPFTARMSWWNQRYVAYVQKDGAWMGILLHDLEHFDDGEYALWGSRSALAFSLYENRIEGAIQDGKRAFMHVFEKQEKPQSLGEKYLRYYSLVSLDKVKDYVLRWEDDRAEYPKYYRVGKDTKWSGFYRDHIGKPTVDDMMNILDRDATAFVRIEDIAPVSYRAYRTSWAQTFDLTAKDLSLENFERVRAAMALVCYTFANENFYPIKTMLAGHPNFLTDVIGTVAVFASLLGKKHPMHDKWLAYYEIALARNFKYHIRPAVDAWNTRGGRWTENVGAYMMCMLQCVVYDCHLVYKLNDGELPLLYPHIKPFIEFLIQIQLPENEENRRLYAPHGAHACTGAYGGAFGHGYCLALMELADMLKCYEPLYAEYLLYNYRNQTDFEGVLSSSGIYGKTYEKETKNTGGTSPVLGSCAYTGFGYLLRDHANTDEEMQVFLQQIDEGPNYRWGRAAQGGCGEIYYYANRRRYTDHAPEDVGDENRGDVQSCTNFGVLVGHEYKSVGRNDLTEPLMDFGFVKYAKIHASEYSYPYYKWRSVMMVENRYIAIYDAVGDKKQHGRFSWAQNQKDAFPVIKNVKPGVSGFMDESGIPVDKRSDYRSKYPASCVMRFDGEGDFFTIVTHLRNFHDERLLYAIERREYGAELSFPQTTDKIFNDQSRIHVEEDGLAFDGYAGYATQLSNATRLAIFNGSFICLGKIALRIPYDKEAHFGMSLSRTEQEIFGKAFFKREGKVVITAPYINNAKVYINGKEIPFVYQNGNYQFAMSAGQNEYYIGICAPIGDVAVDRIVANKNGFTVKWNAVFGATDYEIAISDDGEYSYRSLGVVKGTDGENSFAASGIAMGKYHVRVRGFCNQKHGEYSHAYPVYVTNDLPPRTEGLRVEKHGDAFKITWGEVLGCDTYRLYKECDRQTTLVYDGRQHSFTTTEKGTYFVICVNGIGESAPSLRRSTEDERAAWDHRPEISFIRDTRSHEHGYSGFDYVNNPQKPILKY